MFPFTGMVKQGWVPPQSPFCLIQEHLFPNEWLILVSCIMLNQTSRKQVDRVLPEFVRAFPTPQALLESQDGDIENVIRSLGFCNRRASILRSMTRAYLHTSWSDVRQLPGVGEYAHRAHSIFCAGEIGDIEPKDGSLVKYWRWLKNVRTQT